MRNNPNTNLDQESILIKNKISGTKLLLIYYFKKCEFNFIFIKKIINKLKFIKIVNIF